MTWLQTISKHSSEQNEHTEHSAAASCLQKLNMMTCETPATIRARLSAQKSMCWMLNGSSSGSGLRHLLRSNSRDVLNLYKTWRVTADASQNFTEPSAWLNGRNNRMFYIYIYVSDIQQSCWAITDGYIQVLDLKLLHSGMVEKIYSGLYMELIG